MELLQKEYKQRNDSTVHWRFCRKKGFNVPAKWYKHKPLLCTENESFKILWDFNIQADHKIEHRRLEIIIVNKTNKKVQIVDLAVSTDHWIKIENYQDLKRELQKL